MRRVMVRPVRLHARRPVSVSRVARGDVPIRFEVPRRDLWVTGAVGALGLFTVGLCVVGLVVIA